LILSVLLRKQYQLTDVTFWFSQTEEVAVNIRRHATVVRQVQYHRSTRL